MHALSSFLDRKQAEVRCGPHSYFGRRKRCFMSITFLHVSWHALRPFEVQIGLWSQTAKDQKVRAERETMEFDRIIRLNNSAKTSMFTVSPLGHNLPCIISATSYVLLPTAPFQPIGITPTHHANTLESLTPPYLTLYKVPFSLAQVVPSELAVHKNATFKALQINFLSTCHANNALQCSTIGPRHTRSS